MLWRLLESRNIISQCTIWHFNTMFSFIPQRQFCLPKIQQEIWSGMTLSLHSASISRILEPSPQSLISFFFILRATSYFPNPSFLILHLLLYLKLNLIPWGTLFQIQKDIPSRTNKLSLSPRGSHPPMLISYPTYLWRFVMVNHSDDLFHCDWRHFREREARLDSASAALTFNLMLFQLRFL